MINESYLFLSLLIAWLLDRCLGDPYYLPHPVVGFGKLISWGEKRLNKGEGRVAKGAFLSIGLVLLVFLTTTKLLHNLLSICVAFIDPLAAILFLSLIHAVLIFFCLAGTTLVREVRQVFLALDRSLPEGRKQVARIVGRDTSELSAQEVRTAALETLAENLSDGVIAPLFWYLLLGVPGMLAYKMVNTLDSMIGYKNERYRLFGRVAAKMDDVANYIPARLTALLMVVIGSGSSVKKFLFLLRFVYKYGRQHASPNSGYPEAALAGILNCRFGGAHPYFGEMVWKPYIGEQERVLTTGDMEQAVSINQRAETVMMLLILLVLLIRVAL